MHMVTALCMPLLSMASEHGCTWQLQWHQRAAGPVHATMIQCQRAWMHMATVACTGQLAGACLSFPWWACVDTRCQRAGGIHGAAAPCMTCAPQLYKFLNAIVHECTWQLQQHPLGRCPMHATSFKGQHAYGNYSIHGVAALCMPQLCKCNRARMHIATAVAFTGQVPYARHNFQRSACIWPL
jgi:hypothetical protein